MKRGRVVQRATPATLYNQPATRYGAEFVGNVTGGIHRGSDMLADIMAGSHSIVASISGSARHETRIGDTVAFDIAPDAVWLMPDDAEPNLVPTQEQD